MGAEGASSEVDIIKMIVNIYGSDDLFVSEYKSMLASRLLALTDFNTDKEAPNPFLSFHFYSLTKPDLFE